MADQPKEASRPSPQTDPTNPQRQESAGEWVEGEKAAERRNDEVGLTEEERRRRGHG